MYSFSNTYSTLLVAHTGLHSVHHWTSIKQVIINLLNIVAEVEVYNGGLVDYIYVNTGETVTVKLTVDEYIKISEEDDPCSHAEDYSANVVWFKVGEAANKMILK